MRNLLVCFMLLTATFLRAQTNIIWEQNYGGSDRDEPNSMVPTADGGYLLVGYTKSNDGDVGGNQGTIDFWIVKIDALGEKQWEQNFGGSDVEIAQSVQNTPDGGYLISGSSSSNDGDIFIRHGSVDVWVVKTDALGNKEWEKTFGGFDSDYAYSMIPTTDGHYILAGSSASDNDDLTGNYGADDVWVMKFDLTGEIIWQKNYGGSQIDVGNSIWETADGGYIVAGSTRSSDGDVDVNLGIEDCWIIKLDGQGNLQWEKTYGGTQTDVADKIHPTSDGGFVVLGRSYSVDGDLTMNYGGVDIWIFKIDATGNLQWQQSYGSTGTDWTGSLLEDQNGNIVALGSTRGDRQGNVIPDELLLMKLTASGFPIWEQRIGGPGIDFGRSIMLTPDNKFVVLAVSRAAGGQVGGNAGLSDFWCMKLDPEPGIIEGYTYLDYNGNCMENGPDTTMSKILLYARNMTTNEYVYTYSDPFGHYILGADTVTNRVGYIRPSPYFSAAICSPNNRLINLSSSNQIDTADFYLVPTLLCPYLTVDIASSLLRRCREAQYSVYYCNDGTTKAEDAYVTVQFPPVLTVTSSSIPWTNVAGNTYTFPLGDLAMFECGSFFIQVDLSCDSAYIGQTVCTEAHIYPDTICNPPSAWGGGELRATATCLGSDSVQFKLQNIGIGDMAEPVSFLVIEDVIMRTGGQIQLNSMESASWVFPVNGVTQRISAEQPANHPFKTYTTAVANLCNTENLPPVPGPIEDFVNVYRNDDEAPTVDIDCQTILGAFDPNDKTVYPSGRGPLGLITDSTVLTYKIRFQNTGNDTAFTVVILDTLSTLLDVSTLKPGASSHPYQLEISGTGTLKFIFDPIMLPDSNINFIGSQGYVQFDIRQKQGNLPGTAITNQANIYFDFNPPVQTGVVLNTIGEIFVEEMVGVQDMPGQKHQVAVFPNPSRDKVTFTVAEASEGFDLVLFDAQGKQAQQISATGSSAQLFRNSLPEGLYWYQIRIGVKVVAQGKLLFR